MPQISKQFRGLEDLVESQDRADRINFIGTDISPVLRADPPTLDLLLPVLEEDTIVGPSITIQSSLVPDGFYREIIQASANHDDPVDINFVETTIRRASDGLFIVVRTTIGTLVNESTIALFGTEHLLIPPGWQLQVQFPGLAAGIVARLKTLQIDRSLGLGNIK